MVLDENEMPMEDDIFTLTVVLRELGFFKFNRKELDET